MVLITSVLSIQTTTGKKINTALEEKNMEMAKDQDRIDILLSQTGETLITIKQFSHNLIVNLRTIGGISKEIANTSNEVANSIETQAHSITKINQSMIKSNNEIMSVSKAAIKMPQLSKKPSILLKMENNK